jgi:flagellar biosynthesis/type III secretory pathway protein FliH
MVAVADRLKLSDETDLEILNHNMETIVDRFKTELLPMASQLTARLVSLVLQMLI